MHKTAEGLAKLYRCGVEFSLPTHIQFIKDMEAKRHPIKLYSIYGYSGPCVRVPMSAKQTILGLTEVRCGAIRSNTGSGVIIFPYGTDPIIAGIVKDQPWLKKD